MAAQDITSLGIDITSFSPAKLKILDDFIVAFDKLDKYNGKTLKLLAGSGLADFNNNISQTNKLLDDLNTKIKTISDAQISIKTEEAKAKTRDLGNEIENTSRKTVEFGKKSTDSIEGIGRSLTHMLGYLRNIAYILPGIGLAGIFDKAFQSIEYVVEEMGLIKPTQDEITESQIKVNKQYEEYLDIVKQIRQTLSSPLNETSTGEETFASITRELSDTKALGKSKLDILESEKHLTEQKAIQAQQQFEINGGFDKQKHLLGNILGLEDDLKELIRARGEEQAKADKNDDPKFKSVYDKDIELAKVNLEIAQKDYNFVKKINEDNSNLSKELSEKEIDIAEHKAEQIRKLALETAKIESQSVIDKNNYILKSELSNEQERINAARRIEQANIKIQEDQKTYTLSRNDARNADGQLTTEAKDTVSKANEQEVESRRKLSKEELDIRTEFFQRELKARTAINIDEIEQDAIAQEKIYQNDKISLDKRLAAYTSYILDKQLIDESIASRDLQRGASKVGGKTSLTPEESQQIISDKTRAQVNIEANAQKEIYDIVYSSLQKQLKAIKDEQKEESDYSKEKYIEDLTGLNERLQRKEITISRYNELRKKLDRKDQKEVLLQQIADDEKFLAELRKFKQEQLDVEVSYAKAKLDSAKEGNDPYQIAKAQGEYDAALQAQKDFNKAISEGVSKEQADRLKLAKLGGADENKERKKWAEAALEVERALYEAIKKLGDEDYERRIALIEKRKDLLDQEYDSEIEAIDKSSLSAKDKAALDIQLQEQKHQLDEKAAADERLLKIKEFEFDRKLAIGHIIIGTAANIIKDGALTPKAIADAAVGAIELAVAVAQQPPSYKYGTPQSGHPGGIARYGEDGIEVVTEPYKSPYLVMKETISYLPKGTEVVPINDYPDLSGKPVSDGWEQTKWLGNQIRKSNKEIKNIFRPVINVDIGFERYKRNQLYGRS